MRHTYLTLTLIVLLSQLSDIAANGTCVRLPCSAGMPAQTPMPSYGACSPKEYIQHLDDDPYCGSENEFYFEWKSDFHNHVHLRYGWPVENLPSTYFCGAQCSVQHSQICKHTGFISICHDNTTDCLAKCPKGVHNDVEVEPPLVPLTGESFRHCLANTQSDT